MNHIYLNSQLIVNCVVDHYQKNVHFGAKDFVANLVVKDTMQAILYELGEDMEKEVACQEGVVGEEAYQN